MRIVLRNHSEVAHYWANQLQSEGKANNMFFEGKSIYSYGTHFEIARFVSPEVVFYNASSYSVSTSKHQSIVRSAIPAYCKVFSVSSFNDHLANVKSYLEQIHELRMKATRARVYKDFYLRECKDTILILRDYLDMFKVKGLSRNTKKQIQTLIENVDDVLPEDVEKALKEQERKERQAQEKALKQDIKDWRNGNRNYLSRVLLYAYLRIKDNIIETSKGATVKIETAKILWKLYRAGKSFKGFKLDGYTVIGLTGNILKIGCHKIKMQEVNRIAKELNWQT